MGHAEEDKELMMIRLETLKTMIGKLKHKSNQANQICSHQSPEKNHNAAFQPRSPLHGSPISSDRNATRSPSRGKHISQITNSKKGITKNIYTIAGPSSPKDRNTAGKLSLDNSKGCTTPESTPQLLVNCSKEKPLLHSTSQPSSHTEHFQLSDLVSNPAVCKNNISIKDGSEFPFSKHEHTTLLEISTPCKSSADANVVASLVKTGNGEKLTGCQESKEFTKSESCMEKQSIKMPGIRGSSDPARSNKIIKSSNDVISISITSMSSISSQILSINYVSKTHASPLMESHLKSLKANNDSIVPLGSTVLHNSFDNRGSVKSQMKGTKTSSNSDINEFKIINSPAISLVDNSKRSSPIFPVNSGSKGALENSVKQRIIRIATQPLPKTGAKNIKRVPTHTITRPLAFSSKLVTDIPRQISTNPLSTPNIVKKENTDFEKYLKTSSPEKSPPKVGKVLFERRNKILFDRKTHNHSPIKKTSFYPLNSKARTFVSKSYIESKFENKNFSEEYSKIRQEFKAQKSLRGKSSAKFFSSGYISSEMTERAHTILSKYKMVKNTKHSNDASYLKKANNCMKYSKTFPSSQPMLKSNLQRNVLFQRPPHMKRNSIHQLHNGWPQITRKGKTYYYPRTKKYCKAYQDFVSRRLKYIRRADPHSFESGIKGSPQLSTPRNKQSKKEIILSRHGTNYKVAGNLKSLRRLSGNQGQKLKSLNSKAASFPEQGYPLIRANSKLAIKSISPKQYIASQVLKKTLVKTSRKKVNKNGYCLFFNRFGKCKRGDQCKFIHDADKIAVCTRFLRGRCQDEACLFSHKLDPDKMPVCSYFMRGECSRDNCSYRHVNVGESASICDDFVKGYCPRGKKCTKKHILECEEFSTSGTCSKGNLCFLAHRSSTRPKRKTSGVRPPLGFRQKRRKAVTIEDNEKEISEEVVNTSANKAKKHMLPKFISENIKYLRESTSTKPTSFSEIKNFYKTSEKAISSKCEGSATNNDIWGSDFIPLLDTPKSDSEDETSGYISRMFIFQKP